MYWFLSVIAGTEHLPQSDLREEGFNLVHRWRVHSIKAKLMALQEHKVVGQTASVVRKQTDEYSSSMTLELYPTNIHSDPLSSFTGNIVIGYSKSLEGHIKINHHKI